MCVCACCCVWTRGMADREKTRASGGWHLLRVLCRGDTFTSTVGKVTHGRKGTSSTWNPLGTAPTRMNATPHSRNGRHLSLLLLLACCYAVNAAAVAMPSLLCSGFTN